MKRLQLIGCCFLSALMASGITAMLGQGAAPKEQQPSGLQALKMLQESKLEGALKNAKEISSIHLPVVAATHNMFLAIAGTGEAWVIDEKGNATPVTTTRGAGLNLRSGVTSATAHDIEYFMNKDRTEKTK